ncbi:MAG TPA: UDP-3-O-(3-hydroxymyristoyl)glucosamine N-acyltransferase [Candidatus Omnitrophica bacterium]|nr:MAG: UDP-3-O-(3-hydroxymyristoyl)glucosamine N-acyltransferase [Candidatus Omnitrophota bacterium]RKY45008.1 MAG: UDP-3-O-(3-hydroxymyristoyl)glucosamine N-acyltransferase [Candidatus Omnitrophota bacterium]HEC69479.1 UDP-3-O-(3-hydroxymyristoyl)glucosamine N-acyltransferase [Candidatus Omnitrophota bacterium]
MTLDEIAQLIEGEVVGDPNIVITGISGIKEAKQGDITFLANPKYTPLLKTTQASAIITSFEVNNTSKPLIKTANPSLAFAKIVSLVGPNNVRHPQGIHPTALIAENVKLGKDVAIGAYAIIEEGVVIGDNTIIYGGCFIGHDTKIGKDVLIYPNVSIRERIEIGDRVIIHSGTVIGSDGFGFATVKGVQEKIPQIGTVVIEDDVEIGANVTIDRARFDKTLIGKGTKIDNLVQIAHNVIIGEHSIIVAQAGISGSTVVGKGVILAGQAGVVGHIHIGDGAIVAAQAGVTKSVPPNTKVSGYPAKPHEQAKRVNACVQRLPLAYKRIKELEEEVKKLKEKLEELTSKLERGVK